LNEVYILDFLFSSTSFNKTQKTPFVHGSGLKIWSYVQGLVPKMYPTAFLYLGDMAEYHVSTRTLVAVLAWAATIQLQKVYADLGNIQKHPVQITDLPAVTARVINRRVSEVVGAVVAVALLYKTLVAWMQAIHSAPKALVFVLGGLVIAMNKDLGGTLNEFSRFGYLAAQHVFTGGTWASDADEVKVAALMWWLDAYVGLGLGLSLRLRLRQLFSLARAVGMVSLAVQIHTRSRSRPLLYSALAETTAVALDAAGPFLVYWQSALVKCVGVALPCVLWLRLLGSSTQHLWPVPVFEKEGPTVMFCLLVTAILPFSLIYGS
jgi:hypothetical protein